MDSHDVLWALGIIPMLAHLIILGLAWRITRYGVNYRRWRLVWIFAGASAGFYCLARIQHLYITFGVPQTIDLFRIVMATGGAYCFLASVWCSYKIFQTMPRRVK